ncbi:MAG: TauD/TfdA family dioxygenase [Alphaproteobacteria bacterium]
MALEINRLSDILGAEIIGADLRRWDDDAQFHAIHRALLDHGIVVLRDQDIEPADQVAFSRRFGPLIRHDMEQYCLPDFPEIFLVSNRRNADDEYIGMPDAGRDWHSDMMFKEKPSMGSLLRALEIPPEGGDTLFANLTAAHEALDDGMKARIAGLKAWHRYKRSTETAKQEFAVSLNAEQRARSQGVLHPIVRTHPETGRKSIYISVRSITGIEGMDQSESMPLLAALNEHCARPEFVYRHKWRLHDIVFWDNRCTNHLAEPYDQRFSRHMHRTTVEGDRPV